MEDVFMRLTTHRFILLVAFLALLAPSGGIRAQASGAHLRMAHLAPGVPAIDVYLNNESAFKALSFKDTSDYMALKSGSADVAVVPANGAPDQALAKLSLTLKEGDVNYYTLALVGSAADKSLELVLLPPDGSEQACPASMQMPSPPGVGAAGNLKVKGAFVRATSTDMSMTMTSAVSAAYMTIENTGSTPDRLISVSADVAGSAELHQTVVKDNVAQMVPLPDGIEIPAGGSVELKPGGMHIMLMQLQHDLAPDQVVNLTLKFASGTELKMQAPVVLP
jgi:copper(I)-binding protein